MSKALQDPGLVSGDTELDEFNTDEVTGLNSYTFADRIKKRVETLGLTGYSERPQLTEDHNGIFVDMKAGDYFNGRLPVVVRRLSLDQISALYSLFTSWFAYLTFQKNMIAAERSEALKQKEFIWSHVRKQYKYYTDIDNKVKKRTDQQMSDEARCDYRFVKASAQYVELNTLYECMLSTMEVAEKDMEMVSREVTIVQTKLEHEAMGGAAPSRTFKSWSARKGNQDEAPAQTARPKVTRPKVARPIISR